MVRKSEIEALLPDLARRSPAGHGSVGGLRGSRLLSGDALKGAIRKRALAEGFVSLGVTSPDAIAPAAGRLDAWLAAGFHGGMGWMARRAAERGSPRGLWPDVRSVLVLGFNYGPDSDPLASLDLKDRATISVYARNRDYHDLIKGKLKTVAREILRLGGGELKVFVDTAPVMEKTLAAAAGLGWQGKHTVLISREAGNWLFLGAIYTTLYLPPDSAEPDHCGSCRRCMTACPTAAFPAPYLLDSRRCISYLTIEHEGQIPLEFRKPIGNRIFGCDDCLAVCPWNKFAKTAQEAKLQARADLIAPPLRDLVLLDDAGFRAKFAGSPIKRTGRDRFVRNVLVAIGNSQDSSLIATISPLLDDGSCLVREMAQWAIAELVQGDILSKSA
jgi:epoxyqueuosine reductase